MFELRKAFSPFTATVKDSLDDSYAYYYDTSSTGSVNPIAYSVVNNVEGEWNHIAVIYNGTNAEKNYTYKAQSDKRITNDTEWVIVANDKTAGVQNLGEVKGKTFTVPAYSALIAVEKSTFEECAIGSDFSTLTINSVHEESGELLATNTLIGKPGEGYAVEADSSIPLQYELDRVDGELTGTYSDEPQTITFYYKDFVADRFTAPSGDVNDDGVVDIVDASVVQRFLAHFIDLDETHEKRGDYDQNGETDAPDVTLLQRFLAGMIKPVYTVTTHHYGRNDSGVVKSIGSTTVETKRYGEPYETSSQAIAYYKLDETPANASGFVTKNIEVNYYYSYSVASPVMHVKHSGTQTWAPCLWAWAYDHTGTAINCYDGWPGLLLSNPDEDGWYNVTFPIPGGLNYYFIISKNGNPQTKDYGVVDGQNVGISYDDYPEIWVVINDDMVGKNNDWCTYYNYNPDIEN